MNDRHYCHKCDRVTRWAPARRSSKTETCEECGDRFPCSRACAHLDCIDARKRKEPTS